MVTTIASHDRTNGTDMAEAMLLAAGGNGRSLCAFYAGIDYTSVAEKCDLRSQH